MKIETISMTKIKVNPKNPKLHNDDAIFKSVQTFGIRQPIIVTPDGKDNYRIVAGHGRLTAFSKIGQTDIPCIVWNETDENVINAYMVADNSTVIGGGWNDESLSELMQQLDADTDIDMSVFGFEEMDLRELLGDDGPFDIVEDEPPEAPETAISKTGDLWTLGSHRLLCGDATKEEDVKRLMDGKKADMVFTDPPYGNELGYGRGQLGERYIENDNPEILESLSIVDKFLKNNSHCLIFIQWRTFSLLEKIMPYKLRTVVVWDKKNTGLSGGGFAEQHEWICVFIKGKANQNRYSSNLWSISRKGGTREETPHPTMKPVEVIAKGIDLCSKKNDIILDLFLGSGTAIMAAEQTGRICYGLEISEAYCDVILQRYFNLTNISPIRDDGVKWTSLIKEE